MCDRKHEYHFIWPNGKDSVAIASIDFAEAFDTVCHCKFLNILSAYGITGNLLQRVQSCLTGRSQRTRGSRSLSNISKVSSGVFQGTVLGSLLFVLFINYTVEVFTRCSCICERYADDLKLITELQADAGLTERHL
jgi:Reverse transcriptase (RNA-dependent DNA polymerase)